MPSRLEYNNISVLLYASAIFRKLQKKEILYGRFLGFQCLGQH